MAELREKIAKQIQKGWMIKPPYQIAYENLTLIKEAIQKARLSDEEMDKLVRDNPLLDFSMMDDYPKECATLLQAQLDAILKLLD